MRFYSSFNELYGSQSGEVSPQSVFNRGQWIICNDSTGSLMVDMDDGEDTGSVGGFSSDLDSMYGAYETAMADARMLVRGYETICGQYRAIRGMNQQITKKEDEDLKREIAALKHKGEYEYISQDEKKKRFNHWYLTMLDGVPNEENLSPTLRSTLNDTRDAIRALKDKMASVYKSVGDRYNKAYQNAADSVVVKELRPTMTMVNNFQNMVLNSILGSKFLFGKYAFDFIDPNKYVTDDKLFVSGALDKLGKAVLRRDKRDRSLNTFYKNHHKMV